MEILARVQRFNPVIHKRSPLRLVADKTANYAKLFFSARAGFIEISS